MMVHFIHLIRSAPMLLSQQVTRSSKLLLSGRNGSLLRLLLSSIMVVSLLLEWNSGSKWLVHLTCYYRVW
jgi:hypothetical protein